MTAYDALILLAMDGIADERELVSARWKTVGEKRDETMFTGKLEQFEKRVWLASPTMHGDELQYVQEAYDTNWWTKDNRYNR